MPVPKNSSRENDIFYDQSVKKVLSLKRILAYILQSCADEFENLDLEEIERCIEGEPEVGERGVDKDAPRSIKGGKNEDGSVTEGYVTFDIFFRAAVPGTRESVGLLINIEAQRKSHPDYDLLKRASYYAARLVSSQKETEFSGDAYDNIKKVYSIWICYQAPNNKTAMNRYRMTEERLEGDYAAERRSYDVQNIIMIYLGKERTARRALALLHLLFKEHLSPSALQQRAKEEFDIDLGPRKEEVAKMCNISQGIREEAYNEAYAEAYAEAYKEARAEWLAKGMEKGMEKGMGKGMEKGMKKGMEKGMKKGIEEGYEKRNLEIAKKMFLKNMPIEEIIEFTELPRQIILDFDKS